MVVDIYGSKEIFVNEYRNLLADRLLSQLDFSPEKEIRNLELLKLRFDETLLHTCQVMLKDISDSKRINAHIQTTIEQPTESGERLYLILEYFKVFIAIFVYFSGTVSAVFINIIVTILAIVQK